MNDKIETDKREDIGCLQAIEAFYAYLDGELDDPKSVADFEHHMGHCRSCFSRADVEKLLTDRMRQSASSDAPEELRGRIRRLMDEF
jgi:anti-sigma factor (TIGR02949 family)